MRARRRLIGTRCSGRSPSDCIGGAATLGSAAFGAAAAGAAFATTGGVSATGVAPPPSIDASTSPLVTRPSLPVPGTEPAGRRLSAMIFAAAGIAGAALAAAASGVGGGVTPGVAPGAGTASGTGFTSSGRHADAWTMRAFGPAGSVRSTLDDMVAYTVAQRDDRDAMLRLIATLPPRQRAVIALRFYEDLAIDQIAEILGCRTVTVRTHLSRALATLQGALPATLVTTGE